MHWIVLVPVDAAEAVSLFGRHEYGILPMVLVGVPVENENCIWVSPFAGKKSKRVFDFHRFTLNLEDFFV